MGPRNFQASSAIGSSTSSGAIRETSPCWIDRHEEAMGDALAELGGLHVLGVGVQDVVVARQPREEHDVHLGDGAAGRDELLADLDVFERQGNLSAHAGLE